MHLLVVSSLLPDPNPSTGFEIANRAILEAYRRQGVRLTFVGYRRPDAAIPADAICLGELAIENAGASTLRKAAWVGAAVGRHLPVCVAKVARLSEAQMRAAILKAGPFDAVVVSSIQMLAAYPFLMRDHPCAYVAHNVEHRSASENAANAETIVDRLLYRREAALLKSLEAEACAKADVVHVLSEADKTGLGLDDDPRAITLPLVVGRQPAPDDGVRRQDVGLIGTWSWAPNRIGLVWFLEEVAPLLPGGIDVAVAGRLDDNLPPVPDNVRLLGRVESAEDFVRSSRVLALATKAGTGIQLKTLEAFEEGMPAVATSRALRGVTRMPANVRLANSAHDFASALADLVHGERAGEIGRLDGRAFAKAQEAGLDKAIAGGLARLNAAEAHGRPCPQSRREPRPEPYSEVA